MSLKADDIILARNRKIETESEIEESDAVSETELEDDMSSSEEQFTDNKEVDDMEITKDGAPQFHTIEYFSGMFKTDPVSDIATQKCKVEDLAHNLVSLIQSCSNKDVLFYSTKSSTISTICYQSKKSGRTKWRTTTCST